jgi:glycine hydroxymethyltransferase
LIERGLDLVTGGTDTHLVLVDLRSKGLTGRAAEVSLEHANLTCNKNGIPFDPLPPAQSSGIRLGTAAATSRGFGEGEFRSVAHLIADVLDGLASGGDDNAAVEAKAKKAVQSLTRAFPVYGGGNLAFRTHRLEGVA